MKQFRIHRSKTNTFCYYELCRRCGVSIRGRAHRCNNCIRIRANLRKRNVRQQSHLRASGNSEAVSDSTFPLGYCGKVHAEAGLKGLLAQLPLDLENIVKMYVQGMIDVDVACFKKQTIGLRVCLNEMASRVSFHLYCDMRAYQIQRQQFHEWVVDETSDIAPSFLAVTKCNRCKINIDPDSTGVMYVVQCKDPTDERVWCSYSCVYTQYERKHPMPVLDMLSILDYSQVQLPGYLFQS